jgi:hypothetical protein
LVPLEPARHPHPGSATPTNAAIQRQHPAEPLNPRLFGGDGSVGSSQIRVEPARPWQ